MNRLLPPPVPTHYSPPNTTNISIIQPQSTFESNNNSSTIAIDPPSVKHPSYLGRQQQQQQSKKKKNVQPNELLLDYDSSTSSSDESEGGYSNRFSSQSFNSNPTEEHKFWQVHSSTTIIAPPMTETDFSAAISMNYVNPKTMKKQATVVARIPLAIQVRNILSSTFDDVDEEIEREWESSRTKLTKSLIVLPTQSLSSPSY